MSTTPPYGAPPPPQDRPVPPPYGQPPTYGQNPFAPAPYGASPYGGYGYASGPRAYAAWGTRVAASLLDALVALPGVVLAMVGFVVLAATTDSATGQASGARAAVGGLLIVLGYALAFAAVVWNRFVRMGRTGQSWGKRVMHIRLLGETTGRPVGVGLAFGRELCHYLDGLLYLGYLWPLWDDRRQTFADKICTTVVVPEE